MRLLAGWLLGRFACSVLSTLAVWLVVLAVPAATPAHEGHCIEPPPADLRGSGLRVVQLAAFDAPTHAASAPGDRSRVFVVERAGRVRILRAGKVLRRPFLDLRDRIVPGTPNEQGMWSIAFAPDYERSRRFYVFHSGQNGEGRVEEYRRSRRDPDRAVRSSRRVIFSQGPNYWRAHYGGHLAFGPDRRLYASVGDAAQRERVQGDGPLGKLLRLDPRRPFTYSVRARGLRNPFRFAFDRRTRDIAIADVGDSAYEELNFIPGARRDVMNFGWPVFEGPSPLGPGEVPGHVPPALALSHEQGWHSVTGGHVVRGDALPPLRGRYVYGDFCTGALHSTVLGPSATDPRALDITVPRLTAFGRDGRGRTLVVSMTGWIGHLQADPGIR